MAGIKNITITQDNTNIVKSALQTQINRGLWAVGSAAEGHAKDQLYDGHGLDTGRLRNSITFATVENEGTNFTYTDEEGTVYMDEVGTGVKTGEVYIGTNVEYAPYVELGTSKMSAIPFLKPAASGHAEEYKKLLKDALQ